MLHHALAQEPDHFDFAQIPRKIAPENSHNLTPQEPMVSTLLCSQRTNLSLSVRLNHNVVADGTGDGNYWIEMQPKEEEEEKNWYVWAVIIDGPAIF